MWACGSSEPDSTPAHDDAGLDSAPPDASNPDVDRDTGDAQVETDVALECKGDCTGRVCGDNGCGESCGTCSEAQEACVDGACVCQADCAGMNCGDDGCGGECGSCHPEQQYCGDTQTCVSCETAKCGVCDEIDVSKIDICTGFLGQDHGDAKLTAAVFKWLITTELSVAFPPGIFSTFTIEHFPGESWSDFTDGGVGVDGAGMVACWDDTVADGIHCHVWDYWTMEHGGNKSFDWPEDRPVAHMLFSVADQKRTQVKYFGSWPHNNPQGGYTSATVGTGLDQRACK